MSHDLIVAMLGHTWLIMWIVVISMCVLYAGYKIRNAASKSARKKDTENRQILY